MSGNKLTRTRHDRMIAGVCSGIADYFDLDPTVVRVGYVLLSLLSAAFPGLILYLVLTFIVPSE